MCLFKIFPTSQGTLMPTPEGQFMKKTYIIYDQGSIDHYGSTDEAVIYVTAETLKEARRDLQDWPDGVIYEYDLVKYKGKKLPVAINERRRR